MMAQGISSKTPFLAIPHLFSSGLKYFSPSFNLYKVDSAMRPFVESDNRYGFHDSLHLAHHRCPGLFEFLANAILHTGQYGSLVCALKSIPDSGSNSFISLISALADFNFLFLSRYINNRKNVTANMNGYVNNIIRISKLCFLNSLKYFIHNIDDGVPGIVTERKNQPILLFKRKFIKFLNESMVPSYA